MSVQPFKTISCLAFLRERLQKQPPKVQTDPIVRELIIPMATAIDRLQDAIQQQQSIIQRQQAQIDTLTNNRNAPAPVSRTISAEYSACPQDIAAAGCS